MDSILLEAQDCEDGSVPPELHRAYREQGTLGTRVSLDVEVETGVGVEVGASEARESFGKPSWLLCGQQHSML